MTASLVIVKARIYRETSIPIETVYVMNYLPFLYFYYHISFFFFFGILIFNLTTFFFSLWTIPIGKTWPKNERDGGSVNVIGSNLGLWIFFSSAHTMFELRNFERRWMAAALDGWRAPIFSWTQSFIHQEPVACIKLLAQTKLGIKKLNRDFSSHLFVFFFYTPCLLRQRWSLRFWSQGHFPLTCVQNP